MRASGRLVLALFFLSGAVALGYQVLWSKYLLDFIGVSAYSYATVLACFMAGLAAGGAVLGRVADRVASPLRLFAALEIAIAAYSVVYPFLSRLAAVVYERLIAGGADYAGGSAGLWAKALVAGALLIPATFLMGGTYPAVVRHATLSLDALAARSSRLYAVNAAGSVVGALVMAFASLPALGLRRSLLVLGGLNVVAAGAAFVLARGWRAPETPASEDAPPPPADVAAPAHRLAAARLPRLSLLAAAGFVSFAGEIAWTRYYSIVLGSSTYSFAVIVAAFVAGIAAGSAWLSRRAPRIARPFAFFGWTQLLAGAAILAPLPLYPYLPWVVRQYSSLLSSNAAAFVPFQAGNLLMCFVALLPPTFLMGMSLPLVLMDGARSVATLGRESGRAYAWNTWGNVAGALAAGHFLLPRLGMEGLLRVCGLLCAVIGFAAVWIDLPQAGSRRRNLSLATLGVGGLVALHLAAGPWDPAWFMLFPARHSKPISYEEAGIELGKYETVFFRDDPAANVVVYRSMGRNGYEYTLCVNGKPDASSYGDMPTQVLSGHLPLLLAPDPKRVLVIGLASGVTAGAVLRHPVTRLDVVDIVQAMPEASRLFGDWNGNPIDDPRVRLVIDDARSFLSYSRQTYDVVISEPSNPWTAGTGSLFSADFYARARQALAPGGVYLQWVQGYEMGDGTFAAVVRTFRKAFPIVYGFQANATDLLLIGSDRPLPPDWPALNARFARPAVRRHLADLGITEPGVLLALQRFSPATVDLLASATANENDDDNRLLEYRAPRDLFTRQTVSLLNSLDERLHASPSLFWHDYVRAHPDPARPFNTLRVLSDRRLTVERLLDAYQVASLHLDPSLLGETASREQRAVFPARLWIDAPPSPEALAAAVERGLDQPSLVEPMITAYSPTILLEAALSAEKAAYWLSVVDRWRKRSDGAWMLRALRIELLMTSGRREDAARELRAWLDERTPPRFQWGVFRACQLDAGALCDHALRKYPGPDARDVVSRARALRAAASGR